MIAKEQLKEIGVFEYQILSPKEITFEERLRKFCEQNACRLYGKTWACPPAVGTVAQCKKRCLSYQNALVFNAVYPLEDSFDYEGMMEGHDAFQALCDRLYALIPKGTPFLLLSNEGCGRCKECTYPERPCRMPEKLFPSLEGFGINVLALSEAAGLCYNNGENTVTFFGVLFY